MWATRETGDDPLAADCPLKDQHPPEALLDDVEMAPVTAPLKTALAIGSADDALAALAEGTALLQRQRRRREPATAQGNSPSP